MRAALDIALKDLRQKIRDRSALLLAIVAPLALAVVFSMVLGGLDEDFHAHWAYVDLDGGEVAAALEDGPIRGMEEAGLITVDRLPSLEAAKGAVESHSVEAAIIVPAGFSAAATSGAGANVDLITHPDAAISGQVARSVVDGFATSLDAVRLSVATALGAGGRIPDPTVTAELAELAGSLPDPIVIEDRAAADRQAGYSTYYAGAMAVLFVFLSAQFGLTSLHGERRAGTLARMLATPLHWWSILLGKVLVSMVLALVSLSVVVVVTALLPDGARWGDPLALVALLLAAAVAATGVALLAVAFTRTEEQAGSAVAIVTITLAVLGGSFFPASQGPELLSQLRLVTPHAWFLDAVNDISTGGDLVTAAGPVAVLLIIGLVSGGLGSLRARRLVSA